VAERAAEGLQPDRILNGVGEDTADMRVSLLYNEDAGDGVSRQHLREAIRKCGHDIVHVVEHDAHLERVAAESTELLVAAGGDGTVRRAAAAIAGTGVALAILPVGTANNIAKSFGIDGSIPDLIEGWPSARRVPLDLGVVRGVWGESRFVESVGVGLIPAGIAAMEAEPSRGEQSADAQLARAVGEFEEVLSRLQARRWSVTIDGAGLDEDLLLLEVLNIRSVGPNLVLSPDADPSDGVFSVVAAGERHREELVAYLHRRRTGEPCSLSLPSRLATRIEIHGWDLMHVDDEVRRPPSMADVTIDIEPGAVLLLVR
jgi:diacylglycerol kinase family enzyme